MNACKRLLHSLKVPAWAPPSGASPSAKKSSSRTYRRNVLLPAISATSSIAPPNPPLPWAWIASYASNEIQRAAVELWWQLRVLGQPFPSGYCPWCDSKPRLTTQHVQTGCDTFAVRCWMNGIQPEQIFLYPANAAWFESALSVIAKLVQARRAHLHLFDVPAADVRMDVAPFTT